MGTQFLKKTLTKNKKRLDTRKRKGQWRGLPPENVELVRNGTETQNEGVGTQALQRTSSAVTVTTKKKKIVPRRL